MAHHTELLPKPGKHENKSDAPIAVESLGVNIPPGGSLEHKADGSFEVHDAPKKDEKAPAPAASTAKNDDDEPHYGSKKK